ncbi:MAG: sulfurtransferase TusA family protein [Candidatus Dormibacteraeota bacterium]|nr:sulfurtransferase TusA family protein [Candidatus Dormibacteraeota bacterium]
MSVTGAPTLDLRGTGCPLNYVKTRLQLERMAKGESLEVWLDLGEPAEQVPRSLRMDGQEVTVLDATDGDDEGFFRLQVRRLK